MTQINLKLYQNLREQYMTANRDSKSYAELDKEVGRLWQSLKKSDQFPKNVHEEIKKWKDKVSSRISSLDRFWGALPKKTFSEEKCQLNQETSTSQSTSLVIGAIDKASSSSPLYKTPAADKAEQNMKLLTADIAALTARRNAGLLDSDGITKLNNLNKKLREACQTVKRLEGDRERKRKRRAEEKQILQDNPELAFKLQRRETVGRPRIETDQTELFKTIIDIATYGSAASERRRSDSIRSIKSLDELTEELNNLGYKISRSAVYLRLIPKRSNSTEGKRHVATVPVRLRKPGNSAHKDHADAMFCRTTITFLEEIASVLGPDQVLFISQDDKARVPIGITAANKQAPMLMHVDYLVNLPDHDWVVAERHKLIPSVYGIMNIKKGLMGDVRAVTYSGPTYIAIRSGKHCSSTAASHAKDFDRVLEDEDFFSHTRTPDGAVKPVVMITVDGGPDENPRYEKVIDEAITHFKKHDLDAIFIATNAPGRSAFNRVERRMAPLSKELCGVILEHDHFGSHLDNRGRTVDAEKELQNFEHAGRTLAEIWGSMIIDEFQTKAVYVSPDNSLRSEAEQVTSGWKCKHVRESHYFLQVVKCLDETCCSRMRGTYIHAFPRFVPPPLFVNQSTLAVSNEEGEGFKFTNLLLRLRLNDGPLRNPLSGEVPFDLCCPSIKELLPSRICNICGIYFASVKSVKTHRRECQFYMHSAPNVSQFGAPLLTRRRNNRPVRQAARRQQEQMIIWTTRLNDPHVDWFEDDEVAETQVERPPNSNNCYNLIDMSSHMNLPWEEE